MKRPSELKRRIGELKQIEWSRREIRSNKQTDNSEEFFVALAILVPIISTREYHKKKKNRTQVDRLKAHNDGRKS